LTIVKKLVKQRYLLHMSPANFNGFRVLAALLHVTLVLGVSQTAALNRWRHLYSAGRHYVGHWSTFL